MVAGAAKVDITPAAGVWMDGMIRSRPSQGIHDRLAARALVVGSGGDPRDAYALVSADVCALDGETTAAARERAEHRTGIPAAHIVVAATHTHSGPSTIGIFTPRETAYITGLVSLLAGAIEEASRTLAPAAVMTGAGAERTISHYRRLQADDGHVVMNWEPWPPERIVGPLGSADDEVGVLKIVAEANPRKPLAVVFNHAGHPNILSGDNLLLSADYPGFAARQLEEELGCPALFLNGAQGSVDIDGLRHRDWKGLERAGTALARSVARAVLSQPGSARLRGGSARYIIPGRVLTDAEWRWAEGVLERTGGKVAPVADGVGDDYKALFFRTLREEGTRDTPVEQTCIALDDCALLSFPGELYTEIGQAIKAASPFSRTFIVGLANGYAGYIPTEAAVVQGGYAEDTRRCDAAAERIVREQSLALLNRVFGQSTKED
jgi:neutral ceramidase